MNRALHIHHRLWIVGIPLAMLAVLIALMHNPLFTSRDIMSKALTIDLLLSVPLVYYLLIRKTQIPKTTVVPVMIAGLLLGSFFLPSESQQYLQVFKTWALPLIEISILVFVIVKVRKALRTYKKLRSGSPDFYDALKNTTAEILPKKLVMPFATEVAVIYYGLIKWRSRPLQENEFSYHRNSGTPALFYAFLFIILIETIALHLLLYNWSEIVAWILTGLSLYTGLQVLGFARSLSQRPVLLLGDRIILRYGIMNETEILLKDIDKMELSSRSPEKAPLTHTLSPLGEMESYNVILYLKKEYQLTGLYGMKKNFNVLGIYLDEAGEFVSLINNVNNTVAPSNQL